jgi:hypothetical protein
VNDELLIPISYGSTEVIETGKWGFQKPETSFMTAPCQEACPAGNPIPEFLYLAGERKDEEAFRALLRENPSERMRKGLFPSLRNPMQPRRI